MRPAESPTRAGRKRRRGWLVPAVRPYPGSQALQLRIVANNLFVLQQLSFDLLCMLCYVQSVGQAVLAVHVMKSRRIGLGQKELVEVQFTARGLHAAAPAVHGQRWAVLLAVLHRQRTPASHRDHGRPAWLAPSGTHAP